MQSLDQIKHFLYVETVQFIDTLTAKSQPIFGTMNSAEGILHMEASLRLPLLGVALELTIPPERIELARQFLYTEKPIRPGAQKPPLYADFEKKEDDTNAAKAFFKSTLAEFRAAADAGKLHGTHPVFGNLNNEEWLRFEEKHLRHHLVQFGFQS